MLISFFVESFPVCSVLVRFDARFGFQFPNLVTRFVAVVGRVCDDMFDFTGFERNQ
jgi:hypothetical protein